MHTFERNLFEIFKSLVEIIKNEKFFYRRFDHRLKLLPSLRKIFFKDQSIKRVRISRSIVDRLQFFDMQIQCGIQKMIRDV